MDKPSLSYLCQTFKKFRVLNGRVRERTVTNYFLLFIVWVNAYPNISNQNKEIIKTTDNLELCPVHDLGYNLLN